MNVLFGRVLLRPLHGLLSATLVCIPMLATGVQVQAGEELLDLSLNELLELEVFTPAKRSQPLRDTPGTTLVVTAEQIRARGYRNLLDLMEMLPGFDVQRLSESSRVNDVTMRGQFKHRRFIILQDGVQVDAPVDDILAISDNYPLYHVKQVEVVYGPNSALWGTDAFGGVINIITRRGDEIQGGTVALRRGADGFQYNQALAGDALGAGWSLAVGGHDHETEHANLAGIYPEVFGPVDALSFSGDRVIVPAAQREPFVTPEETRSLFLRADYEDRLTLGLQHHRIQHSSSIGARPAAALYDADAILASENTTLYATYNHAFSDRLTSRTMVDYALRELLPESSFRQAYTDLAATYKYAKGERTGIDQQFNYAWSDTQTLTAGFTFQDFYAIVRPADSADRYDPDRSPEDQALSYLNIDLPVVVRDLDYTNTAGYLQLQNRWGERLFSTLGLRYDRHSEFGESWNPRGSLVYHASASDTWKLTYGEAFRAPAPTEANIIYGSFTGETNEAGEYISYWMQVPNLNLGPEKLRSLELAYSRYWEQGGLIASSYYSEAGDLMSTITTDEPVQFVEGGHIFTTAMPVNQDEAVYYGLDLSIDQRFDLNADWSADLWGAYSYIDGEIRSPVSGAESELNYIAHHKLRFGITFDYRDRFFITPKLRINSETNANPPDPLDPSKRVQAPGYGVMDLTLIAEDLFDIKGLDGHLDVSNVFDRRYYNAGGQGSDVFLDTKPQDGRSWMATVAYRFDL